MWPLLLLDYYTMFLLYDPIVLEEARGEVLEDGGVGGNQLHQRMFLRRCGGEGPWGWLLIKLSDEDGRFRATE